jgi:hypothetical protein
MMLLHLLNKMEEIIDEYNHSTFRILHNHQEKMCSYLNDG